MCDATISWASIKPNACSIGSIFREKNAAKQVAAGHECGITLKDFTDFKEKDVIEVYKIIETERRI